MPPHRGLELVSDATLKREIEKTPSDEFVYWTGNPYRKRRGALRSSSLELITEVRTPISVRELLKRAGRIVGKRGYDPATVRAGVHQHQGSKPTVYLLLKRSADGHFHAATNIPEPDGFGRPLSAGEVVLPAPTHGVANGQMEPEKLDSSLAAGEVAGMNDAASDQPFELETERRLSDRMASVRERSATFRSRALARYGARCAVCDVTALEVLDAVHIRPVEENGSEDPQNGLVLCVTHHRAFDAQLFTIEPSTTALRPRPEGPSNDQLGIRRMSLEHLPRQPHGEALLWRWTLWQSAIDTWRGRVSRRHCGTSRDAGAGARYHRQT
jgi:hypothetical protein